jgi:hypothetical protein
VFILSILDTVVISQLASIFVLGRRCTIMMFSSTSTKQNQTPCESHTQLLRFKKI